MAKKKEVWCGLYSNEAGTRVVHVHGVVRPSCGCGGTFTGTERVVYHSSANSRGSKAPDGGCYGKEHETEESTFLKQYPRRIDKIVVSDV